jgi:integrase
MPIQNRITIERNIKQDTDTKKFYVTFYHGKDETGKNIRKTKTFNSLGEARTALKTHELAVIRGEAVEPNKTTLNAAIKTHLETLSLKSEASTIYGYQVIARHVEAHTLGKRPVQEIKPVEVQAYLQFVQKEKGLSSNSALKHYNFLNSVLNLLEQQEVINRNPVKRVVSPKKTKHEPEYLTIDEATAILERSKGDRIELPIALGLYTGMRRGEISGLTWDSIDFEKNIIRVKQSRLNVGAEIVVKKPKSESSERKINIVPELRAVLLKERENQQNNRALLKSEYQDEGFVICSKDGRAIRPNYLSEMFKFWFNRPANQDLHTITPHELRHSFVAIALAAGVPLYEISQALGHGDIGITSRIYAHLLDKSHINATESIAELLRKKLA